MTVREARPDDVEQVVALAADTPGAPNWPAKEYQKIFDPTKAGRTERCLLVCSPGEEPVAGYVVAVLLPLDPPEAELEAIAVDPGMQGRGLGRALLTEVLRWAAARQAAAVRLEVRVSNLAARGLYRGAGFVETGRRTSYYTHPVEDAVLMEWTPPPRA